MSRRNDATWVNAVLQDVADFLAENEMPASAKAVSLAMAAIGHERLVLRGGLGNRNASPDLSIRPTAVVLPFPVAARRH